VWGRLTSAAGWANWWWVRRADHATRTYTKMFVRSKTSVPVWRIFARAQRHDERELPDLLQGPATQRRPRLVIFRGVRDGFHSLWPYREWLKTTFYSQLDRVVRSTPAPYFACHVRLGDFAISRTPAEIAAVNARLPLEWYREQIKQLQRLFPRIPTIVFSDGDAEELESLLILPDVHLAYNRQPLEDLLGLMRARCTICSGSSFSAWGVFLGDQPSIWFPGKAAQQFGGLPENSYEIDAGGALPPELVREVGRQVRSEE
jgi:Glycosyl transferase family 11